MNGIMMNIWTKKYVKIHVHFCMNIKCMLHVGKSLYKQRIYIEWHYSQRLTQRHLDNTNVENGNYWEYAYNSKQTSPTWLRP